MSYLWKVLFIVLMGTSAGVLAQGDTAILGQEGNVAVDDSICYENQTEVAERPVEVVVQILEEECHFCWKLWDFQCCSSRLVNETQTVIEEYNKTVEVEVCCDGYVEQPPNENSNNTEIGLICAPDCGTLCVALEVCVMPNVCLCPVGVICGGDISTGEGGDMDEEDYYGTDEYEDEDSELHLAKPTKYIRIIMLIVFVPLLWIILAVICLFCACRKMIVFVKKSKRENRDNLQGLENALFNIRHEFEKDLHAFKKDLEKQTPPPTAPAAPAAAAAAY